MRMQLAIALSAVMIVGLSTAQAEDLKVGDKAPDFTLKASDGKTYKLSDFQGKKPVVIAWFPKAFTGGCTKECKSFAANSKALKGTNAAYFTASTDDVDTNTKFAESLSADYPILSDPVQGYRQGLRGRSRGSPGPRALDLLHRQGRRHPRDRQGRSEAHGVGR